MAPVESTPVESTKRRIERVALSLFRDRGYAKTTMRAIAAEAGLSLGAAYHHFESKQDIVAAYYAEQQSAHEEAAREALEEASGLRERLGFIVHTGLDVRESDRALMRELAPLVVSSEETLSAFSKTSAGIRERSIGLYRDALDDAVPDDLREAAALALWTLQLGLLLYFAHDESPRQAKTRALADGALDLAVAVLTAISLPPFASLRGRLNEVLAQAELL